MEIAVFKGKFLSTSVTNDFLSPGKILSQNYEQLLLEPGEIYNAEKKIEELPEAYNKLLSLSYLVLLPVY